jgi:hypothetical protein
MGLRVLGRHYRALAERGPSPDLEYLGPRRELAYGEFINGPGFPCPMPSCDDNLLYASDMARLFGLDAGEAPFRNRPLFVTRRKQ